MFLYLRSIGDAAPLADAVTTALSLAGDVDAGAQADRELARLDRRRRDLHPALLRRRALPLTGVLYVVFALMCVKGWRDWRRDTSPRSVAPRWRRGVVIGKFLPFHTGHRHLIETALARADEVTVIVVARADEPIPGELRARWIEEALPDARSCCSTRTRSGSRATTRAGWAPRRSALLGGAPDVVFTSERYGDAWAKAMGCDHVLVDRRTAHGADQRHADPPRPAREHRLPARRRPRPLRQARRPARRREHRQDDARPGARRALRARSGTPSSATSTRGSATRDANDWSTWTTAEFVEIAKLQNWYEDFLAEHADRRPLLRHGRVDDRALPRDLPRRALGRGRRASRAATTTCTSSATPRRRSRRTSSGCAATGRTGGGCTRPTSRMRADRACRSSSSPGRTPSGCAGDRGGRRSEPARGGSRAAAGDEDVRVQLAHAEQAARADVDGRRRASASRERDGLRGNGRPSAESSGFQTT